MFDVRPFTLTIISTSQDPQCAANAVSFGQDDGTSFIGQPTMVQRTVPISLHFRIDRPLHEGVLFVPQTMEEKWAIFYRQQKIICVRSWTRKVAIVAHVRTHKDTLEIHQVDGSFSDEYETPAFTARMLDFLLRSHVQEAPFPTPLPDFLADEPARAAAWCFSSFGNRAFCATAGLPAPSMAIKSLSSYSLLHIAAARIDLDGMRLALETIHVDAPDKDGRTALHWALASNQVSSAPLLLDNRATIDAQSNEGATPLMEAVQRKSQEQVDFLLSRGAKANAGDFRGFTALHRAAEMGLIDIVHSLLKHGADPHAEALGHTPVSLAQAREQVDIVALLELPRFEHVTKEFLHVDEYLRHQLDQYGSAPLHQDKLASVTSATIKEFILQEMTATEDWDTESFMLCIACAIRDPAIRADTLNRLLVLPSHKQHQAVTREIQKLRSPTSVPYIQQILENGFGFLGYTSSEDGVIAKWFSHALADIGTPEAIDLIRQHAQSSNEEVAEEMAYRLEKIGR